MVPVNIGVGDQFKPEFLALSPNGRMPAIVDFGHGGRPAAVDLRIRRHSAALGRRSGKFYPQDQRKRADVEQWLFWQVGGLGPMAARPNHFRAYGPTFIRDQRQLSYGVNRLHQRGAPPVGRGRGAAGRPGVPGGRLFHRRHGLLARGCAIRRAMGSTPTNSPTPRPGRPGSRRGRRRSRRSRKARPCAPPTC
ncbi:MAG: hypothetical protein WDN45_00770 [Caulobacteraceae bacterium]